MKTKCFGWRRLESKKTSKESEGMCNRKSCNFQHLNEYERDTVRNTGNPCLEEEWAFITYPNIARLPALERQGS